MAERYACDDVEDLRRRCVAHAQWIATNPEGAAFAQRWSDQALDLISGL